MEFIKEFIIVITLLVTHANAAQNMHKVRLSSVSGFIHKDWSFSAIWDDDVSCDDGAFALPLKTLNVMPSIAESAEEAEDAAQKDALPGPPPEPVAQKTVKQSLCDAAVNKFTGWFTKASRNLNKVASRMAEPTVQQQEQHKPKQKKCSVFLMRAQMLRKQAEAHSEEVKQGRLNSIVGIIDKAWNLKIKLFKMKNVCINMLRHTIAGLLGKLTQEGIKSKPWKGLAKQSSNLLEDLKRTPEKSKSNKFKKVIKVLWKIIKKGGQILNDVFEIFTENIKDAMEVAFECMKLLMSVGDNLVDPVIGFMQDLKKLVESGRCDDSFIFKIMGTDESQKLLEACDTALGYLNDKMQETLDLERLQQFNHTSSIPSDVSGFLDGLNGSDTDLSTLNKLVGKGAFAVTSPIKFVKDLLGKGITITRQNLKEHDLELNNYLSLMLTTVTHCAK